MGICYFVLLLLHVSAPDGLLQSQLSCERTHFDTNVAKDVQKLIIK